MLSGSKPTKSLKIAVAVVAVIFCLIEAVGADDFLIFMSAAGDVSKGADIYAKTYVDGYHYYYSVFFALLLEPFYTLPYYWTKFAWLLLNCFLGYRLFLLLVESPFLDRFSPQCKAAFLAIVFFFSLRFVHLNLHLSQVTILVLACVVFGLTYIHRKRPFLGGAILAFGISVKLLPIVCIPYLVYRGYFRAVTAVFISYAFLVFFPSVIISHQYNMALLGSWLKLVNPSQTIHILDVEERSFHGLSTLLSTLLVEKVPDPYALDLKRNIADEIKTAVTALKYPR